MWRSRETGRVFVSFPRWTEDAPVSVAEVTIDGGLRPYPDEAWNAWRNAEKDEVTPGDHWVCVQSVVADKRGSLWVIDPAAPATARVVRGGPKLVRIDLASNRVAQVIPFDERVAPQGSYLNDVRLGADGRHAYVTDFGARGAIVVVDLPSGRARRALDGDPSTQVEKGVVIKVGGRELRRPDGRAPEFAADGIALSPDGRYLYWQATTGRTLYRFPTAALDDARLRPEALAAKVEKVGENGVADGLLIDERGRMYVTSPEDDLVKRRDDVAAGTPPTILVRDPRLRWPDTFAEGPDGAIYVTTSRIQDSAWFVPTASPSLPTQLWRIEPDR